MYFEIPQYNKDTSARINKAIIELIILSTPYHLYKYYNKILLKNKG
jgi:hypothetical protein